ncbi:glycosyl transferase [Mycobacteroides abscessus subsp. abscessus]|nr:glycosyl transferase [Mycobacteroides abscessus subsp. abscessus]
MSPLISVIVPIYNVKKYLNRCLESIVKQTYSNLEIILINDGSTDGSDEICDYYSKYDSRIIVIHKSNGGLSDARNAGLEIAKGSYIAFVDSDDYINIEMIDILYNALIESNCDIAESGYKEVYENTSFISENNNNYSKIYTKKSAIASTIMDSHCRTYVWNKLYKKALWENIRFPYGKLFEDAFTTYKVIEKTSKIIKIDKDLYYYFQRENSIVNSKFSIKKLHHCEALEEMLEFIERNYPDLCSLVIIKFYSECLHYLQELIDNRNNIDKAEVYINNLTKIMLNKRFVNYIKEKVKIEFIEHIGLKEKELRLQKRRINLRLFLLGRSVELLNIFNLSIRLFKKKLRVLN